MADILIAGQSVLDFIFYLDEHPSKPEKYRAKGAQIIGGGCAGNAAVAVARLGGGAHLCGRVGADDIGMLITDGLRAEGVDITNIAQIEGGRSSYSSICIDAEGERQIINVRGADLGDDTSSWTLPPRIDAALGDTRWKAGCLAALNIARERGLPGVLDGEAPIPDDLAKAASHVVFSVQGICSFAGVDDPLKALAVAHEKIPGWVAVTDGPKGVFHYDGEEVVHTPGHMVNVVDTLGAGDVWHGAFALALAEGQEEKAAIRFASATAALKCTKKGGRAGTPSRDEVETFMKATA
ncbi:MAG: PfkB family carbohydrate kinase [Pseudomonadota bacterium]